MPRPLFCFGVILFPFLKNDIKSWQFGQDALLLARC
jgi:hypothetical protein